MSFVPYDSYRDSGLAWIGQIPAHWDVQSIKRTSYVKGRVGWKGLTSDEYLDDGYAYLVTGSDFRSKFVRWSECYCVEKDRYDDDPYIQLRNGDLLITKDGTIGKLAIVSDLDRPACLNSGIFLVRPTDGWATDFLYWALSSVVFSTFFNLASYGSTIQHLYQNVFERFAFPLPSQSEQVAITAFLDHETAKIDAMLDEQQRLIELLEEKRQAVISHAVTKGLNPTTVPMRHSGVEWLGEVPAHWEVLSLRRATETVQTGTTPSHAPASEDIDQGVSWYTPGDFTAEIRLGLSAKKISVECAESGEARIFRAGSVLIVSIGATLGKVGLVSEICSANQQINAVAPDKSTDATYLAYALSAQSELMGCLSNASTIGIMNQEKTKELIFARPPIEEQRHIASYLDQQLEKFRMLRAEVESATILLREHRDALIASAVTGKIDVRLTAAQQSEAA